MQQKILGIFGGLLGHVAPTGATFLRNSHKKAQKPQKRKTNRSQRFLILRQPG
jgi:hypothetical protein